jgi:cell fate regulator YaaT (PSP1 superfamily)
VDTPEGRGTVVEVNLLRQRVKVRMEEDDETVHIFSVEDIAILRNGKAKKNDPPIPADLAPISGAGKRVRREKKENEEAAFLDPIKFRYREEAVVEAPAAEPEQAQEVPAEEKTGGRRRRNRGRSREEKPAAEEAAKPAEEVVAVEAVESKQTQEKAKKSNHRRYHHYRRKPKSGGNQNA